MIADALELVEYGLEPAALILGAQTGDIAALARTAGFRIVGDVSLEEAAPRLQRQAGVDLLVLMLRDQDGPMLDRLLDDVAAATRAGDHRTLIVLPWSMIDLVAGRMDTKAELLIDPEPLEIAFAISLFAAPRPIEVRDISAEGSSLRLTELSEEVGRLARQLAALAGERPRAMPVPPPAPEPVSPSAGEEVSASVLRRMIRARRVRDQFFKAELFADPAWDILLDLAAAGKEGQLVPVSSLCIAAAVPPTTALRWIRTLTEEGLLVRRADPHDGRRVFVALSDAAAAAMDACVAAIGRSSAP